MLKKNKFGYIYKITNIINNKIYIGKTEETVEIRFLEHLSAVKVGKKKTKLYSAMKHYGVENFIVEEIDSADSRPELNEKEKYWIAYYDSMNPGIGYNLTKGGDGGATWSPLGYKTVNNGIKNLQVKPEEVDKYLADGWVLGGHKIGKVNNRTTGKWIHLGDKQKRVFEYELDDYIAEGWELGYSDKGKKNLSISHLGNIPSNKGIKLTEKQKEFTSIKTKEAMRRFDVRIKTEAHYEKIRGSKWVSNDKVSLQVRPENIQYYLSNGYHLGRKKGGDSNE